MTSRKMEDDLEEQPPAKKQRIDESKGGQQQRENEQIDTGMNADAQTEVLGTSAMDLSPSCRRLPLEMNCEMYKFLKFQIQKKFIWGMGRGIYEMFGQKLLKKTKRVRNPHGNRWNWNGIHTRATIAADGLSVRNNDGVSVNVFAVQSFRISGPQCRVNGFPGTILYYYEVKAKQRCHFGFSDGAIPDNLKIGEYSNSYAVKAGLYYNNCYVGKLPKRAIPPSPYRPLDVFSNVYGCGLLLDPEDKLWIFFTANGELSGRVRIRPTVDRLYPAATIWDKSNSFVANFGDDPAKPFRYDIKNCPELKLKCI